MIIIEDINNITKPYKNAVITIGNFDGVHLGHQALFNKLIEKAIELTGTSITMTFEPHPIRVLKNNGHPPLITLYEQKAELIEKAGIDVLICIPFTHEFAAISAKEFVGDILVKRIGIKVIIVGEDYTFGKNREGNLDLLKTLGNQYDFEVIVIDELHTSNTHAERISSTRIRELVLAGKVAESQKLLGRYYQIRGKVEIGRDRGGKLLGFPTANIKLYDELSPKIGVYAVTVECKGGKFKGVANIGYSPTFDDHIFTVEAHILDFKENIYGQKIRVNFIDRLRDEKKFSNISELSEQIKKDIIKAREILSQPG
ncbi:MAG: bifunctional riboflavin kinase/FAD synthetase [Proteobacteria bacterium]|nr:bifunctional riboflavin kinase/FAD synthetase [Pseudomonadota bacterium]MBU4208259.1 bifunctional riboflavin kinase/FAD synthetase [Pseudomonadota bacterium]MBU4420119.1 bifunctional riboflavin kinase/FAD synthetase [Pseudomonadota bacterium]MCG2830666.1 bifunctional riboflavin kinase/FAD synthetase [Desulfobacteraceae bacterium]